MNPLFLPIYPEIGENEDLRAPSAVQFPHTLLFGVLLSAYEIRTAEIIRNRRFAFQFMSIGQREKKKLTASAVQILVLDAS